MNRSFLQLAHVFDKDSHSVGGWFVSTKLDGMRAFWDGGVTRGMKCCEIPFANVEKHARLIIQPISTGLWSRYGQVIHAPDWWLDQLPDVMLDGELYAGRGMFQTVTATVKDFVPGPGWKGIRYHVFDSPPIHAVFMDGKINDTNFKKVFKDVQTWFELRCNMLTWHSVLASSYVSNYPKLCSLVGDSNPICVVHPQMPLPWAQDKAVETLEKLLEQETDAGGEGLIIRNSNAWYIPKRVDTMLKMKKYLDSEGVIVGYTSGRRTDKGSKLLGLMGNMIVSWQGKTFELSGFTDEERMLVVAGESRVRGLTDEDKKILTADGWACEHPDTVVPDWIECSKFTRGERVTFRYRELSDDGIPKEARYHRRSVS